ncbi:HAD family hydrolase [Candidatus Harpocratesius sp.]
MRKFLVFDLGETLLNFNQTGKWHERLKEEVVPEMISLLKQEIKRIERNPTFASQNKINSEILKFESQNVHSIIYDSIALKEEKHRSMISRIKNYLLKLSLSSEQRIINSQLDVFQRNLEKYVSIYPDVHKTLKQLQKQKYILGLWSNTPWQSPGKITLSLMQKYHLTQYFDYIFFSGDYEVQKPDPKSLEIVLHESKQSKDEMVYIGNSVIDIITGVNFGIPTVWINRDGGVLTPQCPRPTLEISSLNELPEMIKNI